MGSNLIRSTVCSKASFFDPGPPLPTKQVKQLNLVCPITVYEAETLLRYDKLSRGTLVP